MKESLTAFLALLFASFTLALSSPQSQTTLPANIKTIIKKNCSTAGCHEGRYPAADLNYEPAKFLASVLNTPSQEAPALKIIDTSAPEKSYLLAKIKGEPGIFGKRMPANNPPLEDQEIKEIETWVLSLKGNPSSSTELTEGSRHKGVSSSSAETAAGQKKAFTTPSFWGTRLVNLPTTQTLEKGKFLFRVSHRLVPAVSSGYENLYGFEGPAFTLLSFGYGVNDNLSLTLGITNLYKEWEFIADWLLLGQNKKSGLPLEVTLHLGGSVITQSKPEGDIWSGRFKLNTGMSFAYQLSDSISFLLVPAYSSNTNHWAPNSKGTLGLGIGGRFMFIKDLSLIAEWIPVLSGYKETDGSNGWGFGLEKKIGGHVFQFFVTNSFGLTASQFITGGDLNLADGHFRFGFNIFRKF
jgi:hypothetical protein